MKIVVFKWNTVKNQLLPSGNLVATNIVYDAEYVNKHYEMISRVMSNFEYVCVTDDPRGLRSEIKRIPLWEKCRELGGCYNRLFIFSKEVKKILGERFFVMDLDTTIIKDFSHLFNLVYPITVFRSINPQKGLTGVKYRYHPSSTLINPNSSSEIWDVFNEDIQNNIKKSRQLFTGTDQSWFNYYVLNNKLDFGYWDTYNGIYPITEIKSKLPDNCCIVTWAGPRDPYQLEQQKKYKWLKEYLV